MREVELKAVITDPEETRQRLVEAGATLTFEGTLTDKRYDSRDGALSLRDEVIRVRTYSDRSGTRVSLDWKGVADVESGYKVREEISTGVADVSALTLILEKLDYVPVREIDRKISQYDLNGATVRVESYPRMDTLLEVEGTPEAIESAIEALGMSRGEFTSESLGAFVARFEQRTGVQAAISDRELSGEY